MLVRNYGYCKLQSITYVKLLEAGVNCQQHNKRRNCALLADNGALGGVEKYTRWDLTSEATRRRDGMGSFAVDKLNATLPTTYCLRRQKSASFKLHNLLTKPKLPD
jgi:hypothetical protein